MAFGISPDVLALSPSGYLQHRRARRAQDIQEAQYRQTRQDLMDRFAQTMASQEAKRRADFAKTQFLEEQKLIREREKIKAGLLNDIAKEAKKKEDTINTRAHNSAMARINAGDYPVDQYNQLMDYYTTLYSGQAPMQPQAQPIQPTFQPAGEEGGTEQPAGRPDIRDKYKLKDPYTEMYPTGVEEDYAIGARTQKPYETWTEEDIAAAKAEGASPLELQPAKELTLDEINRQILEKAVRAKQAKPAPKKEEIPEAVKKTGKAPRYRYVKNQIKKATEALKPVDKEITRLEKVISAKTLGVNKKRYRDSLKALKARREKITEKMPTLEKELLTMEETAREKWEAKQEKIKEKGLTTTEANYIEEKLYGKNGIIFSDGVENTSKEIKERWERTKNIIPKKLRARIEQIVMQAIGGAETDDEISAEIDRIMGE